MRIFALLLGLILFTSGSIAQETNDPSVIGFETVDQAFTALQADPSAVATDYEGWTIFNQKTDGKYILWSFTPEGHPAHPTAVRREVIRKDSEVLISRTHFASPVSKTGIT